MFKSLIRKKKSNLPLIEFIELNVLILFFIKNFLLVSEISTAVTTKFLYLLIFKSQCPQPAPISRTFILILFLKYFLIIEYS